MKKTIYKLTALCFLILFTLTGCNDNEGKVNKIKKEESKAVSIKQEDILHYYKIEYYKFKDNESLLKDYNNTVSYRKKEDESDLINVKILEEEDNIFEVHETMLPGETMHEENTYSYNLIIKNDTEYIYISDFSFDSDIEFMKEVSKEFKQYASKYKTLKEAYDKFCEDKGLSIFSTEDGVSDNGCIEYIESTNEYTVVQYDEKGKVDKVVLENIELTDGKVKTLAVAKTYDGKRVWSLDLGISEKSINYKDSIFVYKGEKFVYFGYNFDLFARDIRTGKLMWSPTEATGTNFKKIIEAEKNIYVFEKQDDTEYTLIVFDYNGESIAYLNFNTYVSYNDKYYQIKDVESAKLEKDKIIIDVYENKKYTNIVGKLIIDTKTNEIEFEKNK